MVDSTIVCLFILVVIVQTTAAPHYLHLKCADLISHENPPTSGNINGIAATCANISYCIGFKQLNETQFQFLDTLRNWVFNSTTSGAYYLLDRSQKQALPKAPNRLDDRMIFGIYYLGECPYPFVRRNESICVGKTTAEFCNSYPKWMDYKYDSATQICTVLPKQTIIASWS